MPNEKDLRTIREQLIRMDKFMRETPDDRYGGFRYTGPMPASPDYYDPARWQALHEPIWIIWRDYLLVLEHEGFSDYRALADKLDVADLLAASKEESKT